jgi:spectinomycin phosphotransferase
MLEKPDLSDEAILTCLRASYGIPVTGVTFLPIGNDSTAWVYRVAALDGAGYFLKVKRGPVDPASVEVPRYVKARGLTQAVAPLLVKTGDLAASHAPFTLILYPYVEGTDAMSVGLTDVQWIEYGMLLHQLHSTAITPELARLLRREDFRPWWSDTVRTILARVMGGAFTEPYERELATFLQAHNEEILWILGRVEALGERLRADPPEFVLCHADIHTANILVAPDGRLHVVDWDNPVLAPRERDLMFVVGDAIDGAEARPRDEQLFFQGYGETAVNPLAMAYYRYEWVVQDIGDYGERAFLSSDAGEETKRHAVAELMQMFDPGDVVEAAYASERDLGPSQRCSECWRTILR